MPPGVLGVVIRRLKSSLSRRGGAFTWSSLRWFRRPVRDGGAEKLWTSHGSCLWPQRRLRLRLIHSLSDCGATKQRLRLRFLFCCLFAVCSVVLLLCNWLFVSLFVCLFYLRVSHRLSLPRENSPLISWAWMVSLWRLFRTAVETAIACYTCCYANGPRRAVHGLLGLPGQRRAVEPETLHLLYLWSSLHSFARPPPPLPRSLPQSLIGHLASVDCKAKCLPAILVRQSVFISHTPV